MKKTFVVLCLAILSSMAFANQYYASPKGKPTNLGNTSRKPIDIVTAFKQLAPGDTLWCMGGEYYLEKTLTIETSGTEEKPVCIWAYGKTKPILDYRNQTYGERGIILTNTCRYVHIKGLTIRYTGKNGLLNFGSYCTFEGIDSYGNCDSGIQMKGIGGHNLILNCDSHDNFDYKLGGTSAADFGGNADGFADKQYSGPGNVYRGCRSWNNSDDGWDFFRRETADGVPTVIDNCWCFSNGAPEYDMSNSPRYQKDKDWFDQFIDSLMVIDDDGETQTLSLTHYMNFGNGNGYKLGGAKTYHDVRLSRCIAADNVVKGYDQNNNYGNMEIVNCTAHANGMDYGFTNGNGGRLTIKNSFGMKGKMANSLKCKKIIQSHNSWNLNVSVDNDDFESLDMTSLLAERGPNYELPATSFAKLTKSSDLLDMGVFVNIPYGGSAPDLGYCEYGTADQTLATEANTDYVLDENRESFGKGEYVNPKAKWHIGYITMYSYDEDYAIIKALTASGDFSVTRLDASNPDNDYGPYNLLVISPMPASTAFGIVQMKGCDRPILLLKPFVLKSSVWNWGTPVNTSDLGIKVLKPEHEIFRHIDIKKGGLNLYSKLRGDAAVTYISDWHNCAGVVPLATPTSNGEGCSLAEFPEGMYANGIKIYSKIIMLGLSEHSLRYLTESAHRLMLNCSYYLIGEDIK